jgi:hypothetical protein
VRALLRETLEAQLPAPDGAMLSGVQQGRTLGLRLAMQAKPKPLEVCRQAEDSRSPTNATGGGLTLKASKGGGAYEATAREPSSTYRRTRRYRYSEQRRDRDERARSRHDRRRRNHGLE